MGLLLELCVSRFSPLQQKHLFQIISAMYPSSWALLQRQARPRTSSPDKVWGPTTVWLGCAMQGQLGPPPTGTKCWLLSQAREMGGGSGPQRPGVDVPCQNPCVALSAGTKLFLLLLLPACLMLLLIMPSCILLIVSNRHFQCIFLLWLPLPPLNLVLSQKKITSMCNEKSGINGFCQSVWYDAVFHCVVRKHSYWAALLYAMHTRFLDYASQFYLSKYFSIKSVISDILNYQEQQEISE